MIDNLVGSDGRKMRPHDNWIILLLIKNANMSRGSTNKYFFRTITSLKNKPTGAWSATENTIRLAGDRSKFDLITLWPSFITTQNISEWISFYWTQSMKGVWVRNLLAVILTLLWKKSHLSWLNQNAAYCIGITAICSRSHCLRISAWDGVRSALLSKDHHWQHLQPSPQKAGLHSKLL